MLFVSSQYSLVCEKDVGGSHLGEHVPDARTLAVLVPSALDLVELQIGNNVITYEGAGTIAKALKHPALEFLGMEGNAIQDKHTGSRQIESYSNRQII